MLLLSLAIIHIIFGILAYGIFFAHLQRQWPELATEGYNGDMINSIIIGLFGILALIGLLGNGIIGQHGLKFK